MSGESWYSSQCRIDYIFEYLCAMIVWQSNVYLENGTSVKGLKKIYSEYNIYYTKFPIVL